MDLVSVVIVNYNGNRFLPDCLESLRRQTLPRHRYEVILVDNGSTDGSLALVREHFPEVHIVSAGKNLGFTGGNNLGATLAHGDDIVLMNNDTVADPHWLEQLVATAEAHPRCRSVAGKLVFHDRPSLLNSAGLRLLRDGRGKDIGYEQPDDGRFEHSREVFGACGASLLIRREQSAESIFNDQFFMYYEDLDLAWGEQLMGYGCVYAPGAVLRHVHCGTTGEGSPFFTFHVERNRVLAAVRNADVILALWVVLGLVARIGRAAWRWGQRPNRRGWQRFRAHLRAGMSLLGCLPSAFGERFRRRRGWC